MRRSSFALSLSQRPNKRDGDDNESQGRNDDGPDIVLALYPAVYLQYPADRQQNDAYSHESEPQRRAYTKQRIRVCRA